MFKLDQISLQVQNNIPHKMFFEQFKNVKKYINRYIQFFYAFEAQILATFLYQRV